MAWAQNAASPSIKEQLEAQYKLSKVQTDGRVLSAGTVLVIQQVGIQGAPLNDWALAPAVYKDGTLHAPSGKSGFGAALLQATARPGSDTSGKEFRPLPVGDKVYVSKIDVNLKNKKKDMIGLLIVECGACNGTEPASAYKASVNFEFAKGYLEPANVSDIEDTIAKVFSIDTGTDAQQNQPPQAGQDQAQQQQLAAPAPQEPPKSVEKGQTIDQVVAILGQPEKTVKVGPKQIYVYKDLKVTFVDGKVSDVE